MYSRVCIYIYIHINTHSHHHKSSQPRIRIPRQKNPAKLHSSSLQTAFQSGEATDSPKYPRQGSSS